jgi:hypothetical protein
MRGDGSLIRAHASFVMISKVRALDANYIVIAVFLLAP